MGHAVTLATTGQRPHLGVWAETSRSARSLALAQDFGGGEGARTSLFS